MSIRKRELKPIDPVTRKPKVAYQLRVKGPRHPLTGERQTWFKQVSTHDEAKRLKRRLRAEIDRGTAVAPVSTTVSELLDQWLVANELGVSVEDLEAEMATMEAGRARKVSTSADSSAWRPGAVGVTALAVNG